MSLTLFGSPQIKIHDELIHIRRRRELALLIYLAVTQRPHSREALANLLWSDYGPKDAFANSRRALARLEKDVGQAWIGANQKMVWLEDTANI